MKKFDIIVIGSGAGLMLAGAAAAKGKKCALIEKDKLGGTCLTRGCIPSKMLVYPADLIRDVQKSERIGLNLLNKTDDSKLFDWEKITQRVFRQINYSDKIEKDLLKSGNPHLYKGQAEFVSERTLRVRENDGTLSEELYGDIIVIASGARPFIPPIPDIEKTGYLTYESFFGKGYPTEPWDSLTIVGGGAIGIEFAHIFSSFGTKVTVVEAGERILATEEEEISSFVNANLTENSVSILTNCRAVGSAIINGKKMLKVENLKSGETFEILSDEIFLSAGVRANSDTLRLENTRVERDTRGNIITDEYLRTTQEGVYAIGDINGKYQLRHTANYEAEVLIHNLFSDSSSEKKKASYDTVPIAIFTYPRVAHVGLTEKEVKESGQAYKVGKNLYSQIAAGISMGARRGDIDNGFAKIIVGQDRRILGAHVVGAHADILIQPFVYLMNINYKCKESVLANLAGKECLSIGSFITINDSMVIHPSFSELTAWALENVDFSD